MLTRLRVRCTELRGHDADVAAPDGSAVQIAGDLVTLAGAGAVEQSSQDTAGHDGSGVVVAESLRRDCRGLAILAEAVGNAATSSPAHSVEAGGVGLFAELAVATQLSPNQGRILGSQGVVVQTQLDKRLIAQVADEDIGLGEQLVHNLEALFVLKVKGDPVLVGVVQVDRGVFGFVLLAAKARALGTLGIAVQRLDLHDFSTHFGQDTNGCGSCNPLAQFDDLHAVQRAITVKFLAYQHYEALLSFSFRVVLAFAELIFTGKCA